MKNEGQGQPDKSTARKIARSAALAALGFAATVIPLQLLLRRQLRDAPEDVRNQGWPIRLVQVIFLKYIIQWIDVEGLENLPQGSYLVAAGQQIYMGTRSQNRSVTVAAPKRFAFSRSSIKQRLL